MKSRNWSCIGYPESLNKDWIQILEEKGCQCAISPLHDKDINPTGEKKKEHYHILLNFPGPTTYNNVKNICDEIGATIPKNVISLVGYYRYLCHLDNPEKAQYDTKDIRTINGFKLELSSSEQIALKMEIIGEIKNKNIKEYKKLVDYYYNNGEIDKFDLVSRQTIFFNRYITSGRYEGEE